MFAISLGDDGAELRPLEPWNAEEYFAHMERCREYVTRYVPMPDRATDVETARTFLQARADNAAAGHGGFFGIWSQGTLVGGVLFVALDAKMGTCEVGCWLEEAAVGRGLITRAMRHLIDWAVDERGIHRVEWQAATPNTASIAVAKRLGMTREGVLRGSFPHRGERLDMEVWSVLAPEWRAHRDTLTRR
ncbi:GNAT family N-acetyltransferase [Streptomyces buecherae]|uniref:GNAT family N-acetyltransferase n=1 Tax=Streptomyces buecherae TaxID=2763006 RepID=UPI001C27AE51|nr:GNAT family protein [Streptomyces buecherae]